jgi:hypothetical protein
VPSGGEHARVGAGFGEEDLSHDPGKPRDATPRKKNAPASPVAEVPAEAEYYACLQVGQPTDCLVGGVPG